jgi:hypothetical protein
VKKQSVKLIRSLFNKVWPILQTAFPDFLKTKTKQWWTEEIRLFRQEQKLNFDILWIVSQFSSLHMENVYTCHCGIGYERTI